MRKTVLQDLPLFGSGHFSFSLPLFDNFFYAPFDLFVQGVEIVNEDDPPAP